MFVSRQNMTAEIANKYLYYCSKSGLLFRKFKYHNNVVKDKRACRPANQKHQHHLVVMLCGVNYPAHRLVWLMNFGRWPKDHIDHLDHDETNNRLENLREVSQSENNRNNSKRSDNTSGVVGVWINSKNSKKKYMAEIKDKNRKKISKSFYTLEEAINQRKLWESEYGYHNNHGISKPL